MIGETSPVTWLENSLAHFLLILIFFVAATLLKADSLI
jgi:hypothetical protein